MRTAFTGLISALFLIGVGCGGSSAPSRAPVPAAPEAPAAAEPFDFDACLADCSTGIAQRACKANCYKDQALATDNPVACDPLLDIGAEVENVAGTGIDIGGYSFCINTYAEERRAPEACDRLPASGQFTEFDRYVCVSVVASRYRDPSICDRLTDEGVQKLACKSGATGE